MITLESPLRHQEGVLAQEASETLILLRMDTGEYYTLNEVGGSLWQLCDGTRTVAEMISLLCQEYDAPPEMIESDALEILEDLAHEKLLVEVGPAA